MNDVTRRMRFAYRMTKAINTQYVIFIVHGNNGYANAYQCYVIRTLTILFVASIKWWGRICEVIHLFSLEGGEGGFGAVESQIPYTKVAG